MKKYFFKFVVFTPIVLLSILIVSLIVHYFSFQKSTQDFETNLERYYKSAEWARPDIARQIHKINSKSIIALGESSLIVPGRCDLSSLSEETFPALLNTSMKKSGYSVLNFGYCGDDSRGVLAEVRYILKKSKPRAFLFYFEHNDFSNASRDLLHRKNSFISSEWLLRNIFFFLSPGMKFQLDHIERNVIEAMIVKSFRMLNSELFSTSEYARYSDRIKQKLIANVIEIAELCRKNKVKAIFISPLGNLLYPPVAADENVYKLYHEGIEKKDIGALMKAADNDYFGYDQRGKLNFSDIFKQDSSEYLLIVNLPKSAYQKDLQFFKESFSDIFHFSKKGHAWVFSELVKEGVPEFISN